MAIRRTEAQALRGNDSANSWQGGLSTILADSREGNVPEPPGVSIEREAPRGKMTLSRSPCPPICSQSEKNPAVRVFGAILFDEAGRDEVVKHCTR